MKRPSPFDRRSFLKNSLASLATGALHLPKPSDATDALVPVFDTNVYFGPCPFRKLPMEVSDPHESAATFLAALRKGTSFDPVVFGGSFEALFHRDFDAVNSRLAAYRDSKHFGTLFLFGAINPKQPDWPETLRRLHENHRMRGIRLHPNYHGYSLEHPDFVKLLEACRERDLLVQIALRMEDPRTRPPATSVPDVDPMPLPKSLATAEGVKIQLLNALQTVRDPAMLHQLAELGVHFEIAMLDGIQGIHHLLNRVPEIQLCYGSYAPFFYPEAAALKLEESAPDLEDSTLQAIRSHHAETLLMPA